MRINYVLLSDLINNNFDIMKISSDIINVTIDTRAIILIMKIGLDINIFLEL